MLSNTRMTLVGQKESILATTKMAIVIVDEYRDSPELERRISCVYQTAYILDDESFYF